MAKYTPYVEDEKDINLLPRKLTPAEAQVAAREAKVIDPAPDMERIGWQNKQAFVKGQGKLQLPQQNAPIPNAPIPNKYSDYVDEKSAAQPAQYDIGNSFIDDAGNFVQGIRKGVVNTGLGINQRLTSIGRALEPYVGGGKINRAMGFPTATEIADRTDQLVAERKRYYEPLSHTKSGFAGDVTGQVAATLPAVFLPGAATIRGGAGIGALQGFASPTTGDDSVLGNTAIGGVLGSALPALFGLGRAAKANLWDPLTQPGIYDRAMKTLSAYGVKPQHLGDVESVKTITGARPSLAEQLRDPEAAAGAARLQDNLATLPDQQRKFALRNMENNEARLNTLRDVAGEGGAKTQAELARSTAAAKDYGEAYKVPFNIEKFPQSLKTAHHDLMAKPAILEAMKMAQKESANRGLNFDPNTSVQSLHMVKEMLDSLLNKAEAQGQSMVGLTQTKAELVDSLKNISKRYDTARTNFAQASVPINQMNVAEELIKRGSSPTPDLYGNPQLRVGGLLGALKDEPALIKRATGGYGGDSVEGLLDAGQFTKVNAVAEETGRRSAVLGAGMGSGSPTAQRSIGLDVLMGGGGMATGGKLQVARAMANYVKGKLIEPRLQTTLTEIALNPGKAKSIMKDLSQKDRTVIQTALDNKFVRQSLRSTLPALYNADD